jgi:predicted flavoprotein YhiN
MSRTQRLSSLAIAAVIAIVAVVVIIASGGGSSTSSGASTSGVVLSPGSVHKIKATQGDQVSFEVKSPKDDEVHVHGYNIEKPVKAGKPLTISFKATINGVFDIEVHSTDTQIGQLTVEPK